MKKETDIQDAFEKNGPQAEVGVGSEPGWTGQGSEIDWEEVIAELSNSCQAGPERAEPERFVFARRIGEAECSVEAMLSEAPFLVVYDEMGDYFSCGMASAALPAAAQTQAPDQAGVDVVRQLRQAVKAESERPVGNRVCSAAVEIAFCGERLRGSCARYFDEASSQARAEAARGALEGALRNAEHALRETKVWAEWNASERAKEALEREIRTVRWGESGKRGAL